MHTNCSFLHFAGRAAAFVFLMAGTASLTQAQQTAPAFDSQSGSSAPLLLAAAAAPADLASPSGTFTLSTSSSSSLASDALGTDSSSVLAADDKLQPPPRRRYGRPNYSDSHTNPDGSSKFAFMVGAGLTVPVGDTGKYLIPSYVFQVGAGRNWSKKFGVAFQFDYNDFGFQGSTLNNQRNVYNQGVPPSSLYYLTQLGGTSHVWSFTLNPTYTFYSGDSWGAYAVVGVGFYHKTANFTVPTTGTYCDPYYGCYQYAADQSIDKYTSNAAGFNGGMGLTYKPSRFAGERFFAEVRYVFVDNSPRPATATNYYPPNANQTYYLPITFGLRF